MTFLLLVGNSFKIFLNHIGCKDLFSLSIFIDDIYDKLKSIKTKAISKTISSIIQKDNTAIFYNYDFRTKYSSKILKI